MIFSRQNVKDSLLDVHFKCVQLLKPFFFLEYEVIKTEHALVREGRGDKVVLKTGLDILPL